MRRVFFGLMACVLALGVAGEANAKPAGGRGGKVVVRSGGRGTVVRSRSVARPYYARYGTRYGSGYYYRGRSHHHWARTVWSPYYKRYHYWDADLRCYFYWDPIRVAYYPVPVVVAPAPVVTVPVTPVPLP